MLRTMNQPSDLPPPGERRLTSDSSSVFRSGRFFCAPAVDLADGYALDDMRARSFAGGVPFFELWPSSKGNGIGRLPP